MPSRFLVIAILVVATLTTTSVSMLPHAEARSRKQASTKENWGDWEQAAWKATRFAINNTWKKTAGFRSIRIQGSQAIGSAGCLYGPDLRTTIYTQMIGKNVPSDIADRFSKAISESWKSWESALIIPSLNWYPGFAAVSSPSATPTNNIPTPLNKLSSGESGLSNPRTLRSKIEQKLGSKATSLEAKQAIDTFSTRFSNRFKQWILIVRARGIKGAGPVPSYNPRSSPVGPVVDGKIITEPHFQSEPDF